jgi:hypothetical protein
MNKCDAIREMLVLYAEEALGADERRRVEQHLAECGSCRREREKIGALTGWLRDPELFLPAEDLSWQLLPGKIAARAGVLPGGRRRLPVRSVSFGWALGIAASLVLACGLIWMLQRDGAGPASGTVVAEAPDNGVFLARINDVYARATTAEYLVDCQDLLVNLLRAREDCDGANYDVSLEVTRARELLQRKRILEPELSNPGVMRAKVLCDEIEHFLVNLSTSQACARPEEIHRMERFIEREQLLLRINLLQAELSEE